MNIYEFTSSLEKPQQTGQLEDSNEPTYYYENG